MRKLVSMMIISMASLLTFPVLAQSNSTENLSYSQQIQKMYDASTAEAKKQFDKTYPKPTAPVIPRSPAGVSETYKPPLPTKNVSPPVVKDNFASSPSTQSIVNPPPDINVNSGKNTQKQNSAPTNIFMPSGSGTSDNNTAPNPYR